MLNKILESQQLSNRVLSNSEIIEIIPNELSNSKELNIFKETNQCKYYINTNT